MSAEWADHLKTASKELLLALRSLIEAGVELLEQKTEEKEEKEKEEKE